MYQGTSEKKGAGWLPDRIVGGVFTGYLGSERGLGGHYCCGQQTVFPSHGQQVSAQSCVTTGSSFSSIKTDFTQEFYNLWFFLQTVISFMRMEYAGYFTRSADCIIFSSLLSYVLSGCGQ